MYIRCIINLLTIIDVHCKTIEKIDELIVFIKSENSHLFILYLL